MREVHATHSPSMDIQVSSNFERLLFEAYGRDGAAVRAVMASLAQSRAFRRSRRGAGAIRAEFDAGRADEAKPAPRSAPLWREAGDLVDPHTAVGLGAARREARPRGPAMPMIVLAPRMPPSSPMRSRPPAACGRPCRRISPVFIERPERVTLLPQ